MIGGCSDLVRYRDEAYYQQYPFIRFDTLKERHTYQIAFAFVDQCRALSIYDTGVKISYGDKLITLSTCEYSQTNGRFVAVAKRIS